MVVHSFQIFYVLGIPNQKPKTLFLLLKVNKSRFFWKLIKNQIAWHHSWCHDDGIVQIKVVEAPQWARNENCHQDAIKRNIKPKFSPQTPFRTVFVGIANNSQFCGVLYMKTAKMCFSKTCVNFGRCYGNQGWAEVVENILFGKWIHLNCQKVSSL